MIDQIIKDLRSSINDAALDDIEFLALLGSYRENEAIAGYSDCDFLFLLKADQYGNISNKTLESLKEIALGLSARYAIVFSFLTHTEFDLREYVDIEYLEHYSWGNVLIGEESEYQKLFITILAGKDTAESARKALMYYNVIHARFNILRKYVSINRYNSKKAEKDIAALLVDKVIEIIDWILIYDGDYFGTKQEIVDQFKLRYEDIDRSTLNSILPLRSELGGDMEMQKLNNFNRNAIELLNQLSELIIKKHKS
ncbi:hypothetical protein A2524_02765 [Candidatus Wolfebacteria bacterium RIFOXYD12_FULL_48_21]|nr:MAG: hypothetical protein A2524_02765 [Candidatus Wolfebacteria bacterium RIFOXYD12_FULL_48_21]